MLRIREKGGCWRSNPFGLLDRIGGKKVNPMSHPTHLREKGEGGAEFKGIESAPYLKRLPLSERSGQCQTVRSHEGPHPPRLPLRHVAAPQWSRGVPRVIMSLNVKTMNKCRSDTCPIKSATWQPMMGATWQTESGRVESGRLSGVPKRRAGVLLCCTECALVSNKGS